MNQPLVEIIDVTENPKYERFLYRCIFHVKKSLARSVIFKNYEYRHKYLKSAIPRGFHKKVLFYRGNHVGMIEYAPAQASGLPIKGKNIIVMNCIWVHRSGAGNHFGKRLMIHMMEENKEANGFATLGCGKTFYSAFIRKDDMEKIGFKSVKSIRVKHKGIRKAKPFTIHLMWLPITKNAKPPSWDESKLLEGLFFCEGHPLHHERHGVRLLKHILEKC